MQAVARGAAESIVDAGETMHPQSAACGYAAASASFVVNRAVACLPALTGAWRHRAGGVLLSSSGQFPVDRAAL